MRVAKKLAIPPIALFALFILWGCRSDAPFHEKKSLAVTNGSAMVQFDLAEIQKRGKLIALTQNSSTSYFVYRGQAMGFEYELLKKFARSLNVELEIKVVHDLASMFDLLNQGVGDIIACNLSVTNARRQRVRFSQPYNFTRQVLVQRGAADDIKASEILPVVKSPLDLIGKKVYVNQSTSFYSRLHSLENEIGGDIKIVGVPGYFDVEELIEKVAGSEIDFTVADDNVAKLNATYFSNIDIEVQLSFPQKVAWAARLNAPNLQSAINSWMEKSLTTAWYRNTYNKYFNSAKEQRQRFLSEYSSLNGQKISPYDDLLKEYSTIIDWDWRLLAAQMYQESHFDKDARSWAGAFGLMQFMPETAEMYGIDSSSTEEEHIRAAILYLSWLDDFWQNRIFNPQERIKFILASYNVGLGHVLDAVQLAVELGFDPQVWKGNVAECILLKSQKKYFESEMVKYGYCRGKEPYEYVKKILYQYEHYKQVINA